jgi:hypothetical protein
MLSPLIMGADGSSASVDERTALQDQRRILSERLARLKREEDFLLFQKSMYVADSKYLVINVKNKTGQLKYKNRVLKDLRFTPLQPISRDAFQPGKLVLTKKAEGKRDRHALIFGNTLVIQWKRDVVPQREKKIPVFSLKRKEMLSVFFSLDEGSLVYVLR